MFFLGVALAGAGVGAAGTMITSFLVSMTQILEESATAEIIPSYIGIRDFVQFILRTGYVTNYPQPVSLQRPVGLFVRT